MVELSETPIYESQFPIRMVYHYVVGFYVSVHDSLRVAVVKGLEHFIDVVPNIKVSEALVQSPKIHISRVHELHYQSWSFGHGVPDDIDQVDDVDSVLERLQDLNFPSYLSLLYWLQNLYYYPLIIGGIDAFVDLRVFASANLLYDFVVVLRPELHLEILVV